MPKVSVKFVETTLHNDEGRLVEGVVATCSECNHQTESFGTHERSRKRCLALMKEECPQDENNFYVDDDADE